MEFTPPALIALLRTVFDEVSLMVRVFPAGAMSNEPPPPVAPQPSPAQRPRSEVIRATAALVRKVAPGAVERIKRAVEPAPPVAPPVEPPPPQEWLASDIVWAPADDPTVTWTERWGSPRCATNLAGSIAATARTAALPLSGA